MTTPTNVSTCTSGWTTAVHSQMKRKDIPGLFWLGGTLGIVHVMTGPDHMTALVQLSCGARFKGFWMGLRWGLGHSAGLLLMYTFCAMMCCLMA